MASPQPALRQSREPDIRALSDACPLCDQPIPNEKAKEIRARMEAHERSLAEAANTRAAQRIAAEKAQIEAGANAAVEKLRRESEEALKKRSAEAWLEGGNGARRGSESAEAAFQEKVSAAEKARGEAEAAAALRVAEIEQAASARRPPGRRKSPPRIARSWRHSRQSRR